MSITLDELFMDYEKKEKNRKAKRNACGLCKKRNFVNLFHGVVHRDVSLMVL
jgi:hypothetical protein